ncbi:hypothetical protein BJ684DRAFT_21368, partial [Piptocephalis cylindrospora]
LPHTKEPKFLCKNIIHFFTLLSQTQEGEIQRLSSTKDLITLVTGLAHYLKNLIRIGLKGALRMENEHGSTTTISAFLSKLMELEEYGRVGGKKKMVETIAEGEEEEEEEEEDEEETVKEVEAVMQASPGQVPITSTTPSSASSPQGQKGGVQGSRSPGQGFSLGVGEDEEEEGEEGDTGEDDLFGPCHTREEEEAKARAFAALTDRCVGCQQTLEEQCIRSGPWRWHDTCLMCVTCGVPLVLGREERHVQRQIQVQQAFGRSPSTSSTSSTVSSTSSLARNPRLDHMSGQTGQTADLAHQLPGPRPHTLGRRMTKAERRRTLTLPLTRPGSSVDLQTGHVYCPAHAPSPSSSSPSSGSVDPSSYMGEDSPHPLSKISTARFTRVSQLKQYVFLLRVAQQHLILKLMSSQQALAPDSISAALGGGHITQASSPVRPTLLPIDPTAGSSIGPGGSVRMGPSSSTWGGHTTTSAASTSPSPPSSSRTHPYGPQGTRAMGPSTSPRSGHPDPSSAPPSGTSTSASSTSRRRGRDEVEGLDRRLSNSAQLAKRRTIVHHQSVSTTASTTTTGLSDIASPGPRGPLSSGPMTSTSVTSLSSSGHLPPSSSPSSTISSSFSASAPSSTSPKQGREAPTRRKYLSELTALELTLVRHLAVLFMHPCVSKLDSYYDAMDPLMVLVDPSRSSLWRRLKSAMNKGGGGGGGGGNDTGDHNPSHPAGISSSKVSSTFGVPLDVLVERTGVTAPFGIGPIPLRVPSFLAAAIGTLREKDVTIEGIYRKNGNIRRLRELTETIDRSRGSLSSITGLLIKENAVQIAALVKKFLRDLPDPLLSYKIHRLLITICKMEDEGIASPSLPDPASPSGPGNSVSDGRVHLLHLAYCLLPEENRDVLEVLLAHFRWISQYAEIEDRGNKMDLSNMATVVTPNILYSKSKDPSRDESFYANEVVLTLLESQDELAMVPAEIAQILKEPGFLEITANGLQLSSKELMKRCEAYIRPRKAGSRPGNSRVGR